MAPEIRQKRIKSTNNRDNTSDNYRSFSQPLSYEDGIVQIQVDKIDTTETSGKLYQSSPVIDVRTKMNN